MTLMTMLTIPDRLTIFISLSLSQEKRLRWLGIVINLINVIKVSDCCKPPAKPDCCDKNANAVVVGRVCRGHSRGHRMVLLAKPVTVK
jgi:hypothetical protein